MTLPSFTEFSAISYSILSNPALFQLMREFKSTIQLEIIPLTTAEETEDIRNCIPNEKTIEKLITLGASHFSKHMTPETLYCASMAVGTIIREYDWGWNFVSSAGVYEIAKRINSKTK